MYGFENLSIVSPGNRTKAQVCHTNNEEETAS